MLQVNQSSNPDFIFCLENHLSNEKLIDVLISRLRDCNAATVVLGFRQLGVKRAIEEQFARHKILQVISHLPPTTEEDVEDLNIGKMAFYCDMYTAIWMALLALNKNKFEILIPKVRFAQKPQLSYFDDSLRQDLKAFDGLLDFPQYIVLKKQSELHEVDCLDYGESRGRPIARSPNLSDLVEDDLPVDLLTFYSTQILDGSMKVQPTRPN